MQWRVVSQPAVFVRRHFPPTEPNGRPSTDRCIFLQIFPRFSGPTGQNNAKSTISPAPRSRPQNTVDGQWTGYGVVPASQVRALVFILVCFRDLAERSGKILSNVKKYDFFQRSIPMDQGSSAETPCYFGATLIYVVNFENGGRATFGRDKAEDLGFDLTPKILQRKIYRDWIFGWNNFAHFSSIFAICGVVIFGCCKIDAAVWRPVYFFATFATPDFCPTFFLFFSEIFLCYFSLVGFFTARAPLFCRAIFRQFAEAPRLSLFSQKRKENR